MDLVGNWFLGIGAWQLGPCRLQATRTGSLYRQTRGLQLAVLAAYLCATLATSVVAGAPDRLKVSEDGHYLVLEDGTPFFWLADTAWHLFHRLNREEADRYLEDRASKGFTVIQAVVLAEHGGLTVPNPYGHLPLIDKDPTKPNEAYFEHVDYIVKKAGSLDLFVGMLPTWGDKVRKDWGEGPEIFNPRNARLYGEFLGKRYRDSKLIWILGGDRSPVGHEATWRAMTQGLEAGDQGRHLVTFHGADRQRRGSSPFFHHDDWLDFNMYYAGHRWADPNYEGIARDYALTPTKPTLDGEPRYENHPYIGDGSGYYKKPKRWDGITRGNAHQMREAAYWAMLAGAAGHTYGCHDVWQMYDEGREPVTFANTPWQKAIDFPGARQMGLMRRLFQSRPWQTMVPDQSIIAAGQGEGEDHIQAGRAGDGGFLFAYLTFGNPITVNMSKISGHVVEAHWFDPREGTWTSIGSFPNSGTRQFVPPRRGRTWDWVLVLDDESKRYPSPGTTPTRSNGRERKK